MSDQPQQPHHDRTLSEISHLFLSSIRDRATGGGARPQRTPPPKSHHTIDLSPEEFAQIFGGDDAGEGALHPPQPGSAPVPPVTAVIAGHLSGKQFDRVKEYARHLASSGSRIGLIETDPSEFRVMLFDKDQTTGEPNAEAECSFDPRRMNEVLEELSWDVQRWLLVLPTPRVPEARALLRDCSRWLLLSTCDHDGVIACYRTLKGLTDLWPTGPESGKPRLSVAMLDAEDDDHAQRVAGKLTSVCQQFLSWPVEAEAAVRSSQPVGEHLVMCCRPTRDKGQLASAPQWQIVADLVARSKQATAPTEIELQPVAEEMLREGEAPAEPLTPEPIPAPTIEPARKVVAMKLSDSLTTEKQDADEVIDLPAEAGEGAIVEAILRHCAAELVECPVTPPMCPKAKLAVSRDHRVVLLAVARQGLADLSTIGQAYRWLRENQNLIGMAVPQLSIDTQQPPHLSLLVDQSDSSARTLQPMLEGGHVTVKTYRKLRWGGKTGLLLEAA
jgi:hypothetical protein